MLDALRDNTLGACIVGLGEGRCREARCVQRLQQVMTNGREKASLEAVGTLGRIACGEQLIVGAFQTRQCVGQLLGAQTHLAFERYRGLEQGVGVRLLVHRTLDTLHQRCVDLLQLDDAPFQLVSRRAGCVLFELPVQISSPRAAPEGDACQSLVEVHGVVLLAVGVEAGNRIFLIELIHLMTDLT